MIPLRVIAINKQYSVQSVRLDGANATTTTDNASKLRPVFMMYLCSRLHLIRINVTRCSAMVRNDLLHHTHPQRQSPRYPPIPAVALPLWRNKIRSFKSRRSTPRQKGKESLTRPGCLLSSNAFEVLQAAIGGLDSPHRDYDDVNDEQPNHQRQHAREPVIQEQREHDKWRHDRPRSPDGVPDAVGAKSHLSREQLRRVNSEQDRDLDVDRDDQQEANREQAACLVHERINRSQCDRS